MIYILQIRFPFISINSRPFLRSVLLKFHQRLPDQLHLIRLINNKPSSGFDVISCVCRQQWTLFTLCFGRRASNPYGTPHQESRKNSFSDFSIELLPENTLKQEIQVKTFGIATTREISSFLFNRHRRELDYDKQIFFGEKKFCVTCTGANLRCWFAYNGPISDRLKFRWFFLEFLKWWPVDFFVKKEEKKQRISTDFLGFEPEVSKFLHECFSQI